METADVARLAADRIVSIASIRGFSVNKMLINAGLDKSVVDRMKRGTMPSVDKIAAIASQLDVPMDFLIGSGVFAKWDLILEHKSSVVAHIADMMKDLSTYLKNGVDDFTLAKLVWAFGVDVDMGTSPAGLEITVLSPIAVYGPAPSHSDFSDSRSQSVKKEPASDISDSGREMREMMELFKDLPLERKRELIGEARAYHRLLVEEKTGRSSGRVG